MAPKKRTSAPTRRSARIQSRESSVASEENAVISSFATQLEEVPARLVEVEKEPDVVVNSKSSLRRDFTLEKIHMDYEATIQKQAEEAAAVAAKVQPAASPKHQEHLDTSTHLETPTRAPATEMVHSGWRKALSSLGGYIASPFTRKRAAEDEDVLPAQKRNRIREPETATPIIAEQTHEPELEPEPESEITSTRSPQPSEEEKAQYTPRQRVSIQDFAMPSSKNPRVPTSLSTITEHKESSFATSVSESTPSKPPRAPSQRSLLQVTQSTPNMRRLAQMKAANSVGRGTSPAGWAWERSAPKPKPKERNADARHAKMQRMLALQQELKELEDDDDIREMQSHKRKRVKVDNLVTIPHNLPGDPSGMFRVPEVDSDDEMEVYDVVEERSNVFEEMNSMREPAPEQPVFRFPSVARKPANYHVSKEFKAEACRLFETGFAEYLRTGVV